MYHTIAVVRNKISDYQAILYLLTKPDSYMKFERDPQLMEAIVSGDIEYVRNWFKTDLDSLSLAELRDLAQREGVRPVYGKSKATLIMEIMDQRQRRTNPPSTREEDS